MSFFLSSLAIAIVSLTKDIPLPPVPVSEYLDSEASISSSVVTGIPSQVAFGFDIRFVGTPSNNVEVLLGRSGDGINGLSPEHGQLSVGWDCGFYFLRTGDASVSYSFPARNEDTNRWIRYTCKTEQRKLLGVTLETDSGFLCPTGYLSSVTGGEWASIYAHSDKTEHRLRWELTCLWIYQGCYFRYSNLILGEGLYGPDTVLTNAIGAALGQPTLPFRTSTVRGSGSWTPHVNYVEGTLGYGEEEHYPGGSSYGSSIIALETTIYGAGTLSFNWSVYYP